MAALKYWVWLSSQNGVSAVTAGNLLRKFGSPELVYFARTEELRETPDIKPREVSALGNKDLSRVNKILSDCETLGCRVVTIQDAEYPERLSNIYDPPIVLYIRGRLPVVDEEPVVAVIGTRSCTPYGMRNAERIAYSLARRGFIVVSGLARGVDSAAALGALRGGGRVIGVVGGGTDVVYPPENAGLYEDVTNAGVIISEYPPGTKTLPGNFPARNRIISGLALGVAVIEAPARSGALITASRALEQGRDVFAMPGNVDSTASAGANKLLREGALPLTAADDITREYYALFPSKIKLSAQEIPLDPKLEKRLLESVKYAAEQSGGCNPPSDEIAENAPVTKPGIDKTAPDVYIDRDKYAAETAEKLDEMEKAVFLAVAGAEDTGIYIDEIINKSGLTAADTLGTLTILEIEGYVKNVGGNFFLLSICE